MSRGKKRAERRKPDRPHTGTSKNTASLMLSRIKHRNELMRSSRRQVKDLTSFEEIDFSALSISPDAAAGSTTDHKTFEVNLSVGFLGWDDSYPVGPFKIDRSWLQSKEIFHRKILGCVNSTFGKFGCVVDSHLYGYEVQYVLGYSCIHGNIDPHAFAIIDTPDAFEAWIDQHMATGFSTRSVTARFVHANGTRFDPTFRTKKEVIAETNLARSVASLEASFGNVSITDVAEATRKASQIVRSNKISPRTKRYNRRVKRRAEEEAAAKKGELTVGIPDNKHEPAASSRAQSRTYSLPEADLRLLQMAMAVDACDEKGRKGDMEMSGLC